MMEDNDWAEGEQEYCSIELYLTKKTSSDPEITPELLSELIGQLAEYEKVLVSDPD